MSARSFYLLPMDEHNSEKCLRNKQNLLLIFADLLNSVLMLTEFAVRELTKSEFKPWFLCQQ